MSDLESGAVAKADDINMEVQLLIFLRHPSMTNRQSLCHLLRNGEDIVLARVKMKILWVSEHADVPIFLVAKG